MAVLPGCGPTVRAESGSAPDAAQEVNTAQEESAAQDGSTAQGGAGLQTEDWPEEITVVQMPNENNPNVGQKHEEFSRAMDCLLYTSILVHLYEWHQLLLNWEENNKKGLAMPFIPAPYNWKTYGQMNVEFWKKHQDTSYEEAREMLLDSHRKVMELIKKYSNEELFEKKHFSWTGTSNLDVYKRQPL